MKQPGGFRAVELLLPATRLLKKPSLGGYHCGLTATVAVIAEPFSLGIAAPMDAEREDFARRPDTEASSDDATDPRRRERLATIRAMIEDGTYETAERLEAAVSRFLSAVGERT